MAVPNAADRASKPIIHLVDCGAMHSEKGSGCEVTMQKNSGIDVTGKRRMLEGDLYG